MKKLICRLSVCAGLFLSAAGAFGASTYYVATTGDDGAAGTADAPWATVTHAVATASAGDVIHVGEGTWTWSGKVEKGFTIEGEGDATILKTTAAVTFDAADLVIKNCRLSKNAGANYCSYTLTSGMITNCLITGCSPSSSTFNTALNLTGGLLVDCRVTNNKAANGHAYPSYSGGSSCNAGGSAVIRNCLFTGNYTTLGASSGFDAYPAGALCIWPAAGNTVTLENCTFAKNTGGVTGAVIFGGRGKTLAGNVVLRGCVLAGNKAPMHPGEMNGNCSADFAVYPGKGTITMENCLIGDKPDNFDSLVNATGCSFGTPGFTDEFNGDYTLAAGSPRYGYGYHAGTRGAAFSCAVETPATDRAIASLALTLKALTFNAPEGAASYEWDFDGDGTYDETTDAPSVAHTFTTPGWNKVGLRVTVGGETAVQPAANLFYVAPAVIYVCPYKKNTTGNEIFPYDTPYNAAKLVSTALKAAIPGSRIEVAAGTYSDSNLTISDVTIAGAGRTTTIVKSLQMRFYANARAENIQLNGTGSNNPVMTLAADSAALSNCWITSWKHTSGGTPGGSYLAGTVDGCLFTGCYCNGGSGVFSFSGRVKARNNVFTGNYFGGAEADHYGIFYLSGNAAFENNVVYGNHAVAVTKAGVVSKSAGIYVSGGSPVIRNCVIRHNMKDGTLATGTEANWCIAAGAAPVIANCNTPDAPDGATGCQTADPSFVGADDATAAANRDFRLKEDSPCIGKGLYADWQKTAVDAAGNARFQGYGVDIGAYEVEKDTPALGIATDKAKYYGAQEVTFAAASTNGVAMAPDTTYLWTVNGVEQDESSATLVKYLETGAAAVSVVSRQCGFFSAETDLVVHEIPGVDFDSEETVGIGKKTVTFSPRGTGGLTIDGEATYAWYVNDETGAGEPVSTEKTPTVVFDKPGTYGVFLRVSNADGAGAAFEKYRPEGVIVEPLGVDVAFSETTGEGRTLITMTATPTGFEPDEAATYEWRWTNLESAMPELTGNSVTGTFRPGTWSVQIVVANADGAGLAVTNTLVDAVTIAPGADFYVSASGADDAAGTKASPYKTFRNALAHSFAGAKIRIVGMLKEDFNNSGKTGVPISNVEIYGDDRTKDGVTVGSTSADNCFVFGEGAFVHGLKLTGSRAAGGVIRTVADSTVISNCWITGNYYSSGGNPAGVYTAGLITHVLFTGNRNDNSNGTLMSLSGTTVMRNCVFTGNNIKSNLRGPLNGVVTLEGAAAMENCVIYGNTSAASSGGDAYAVSCRPRNGGGIYIPSGSPTLRNCIVRNNKKPPEPSDGKYPTGTGEDIYSASEESDFYILEAASPVIEDCNVPEGQVPDGATNCQTGDPLFVDPDNATAESRNFAVQSGSPCIDAGLYQAWQPAATDYVGLPRFQGQNVDIGAYEFAKDTPALGIAADKARYYGAQDVTLTASSTNEAAMAPGTTYLWTVDGVEQDETSGTLVKYLETGTYQVTATSRQCDYFTAAFELVVHEVPGVDFDSEETAGVGRKTVTFTPRGTGGLTIDDAATYAWYVNDETGEGEPVSTEKTPTLEFDKPGTYGVLLKVMNADGAGVTYEKYRPEGVVVETPGIDIALSETTGEGRTLITLTATPTGFVPDEAAKVEWRWTDLQSATPELTGNPVIGTFRPGTWSVQVVIANADGKGLAITNAIADAVTIAPGADFYVAPTGDNANPGTKKSPYKTLAAALDAAAPGQKIKISGLLKDSYQRTVSGVEIYGDGPAESGLWSDAQSCYLKLTDGAFIHGIRIGQSREQGGILRMADDSCVVSNCWVVGNWFTTGGSPAGDISAGLVTHTLFSGNHCNYGPVVSVGGTAKVRNCVFTGNTIDNGADTKQTFKGVVVLGSTAVFENNTVYGNTAVLCSDNVARQVCAGVYVSDGTPTVRNNIIWNNRINGTLATGTVGNYYCKAGEPVLANNCTEEGVGENPVTGDPGFTALDMTKPAEQRDFSITTASPCCDRGVPAEWLAGATDYAGNPRVMGWGVDLGAYEAVAKILEFGIEPAASVVTGAQAVAVAVTGDTASVPAGAVVRWFVA